MAPKPKKKEIEFPADIPALKREQEDVKAFLQSLEDAYNEGSVTEESYDEMKRKNAKRLVEINNLLGEKDEDVPVDEKRPTTPEKPPVEKTAPGKAQEKKPAQEQKRNAELSEKIKTLTEKSFGGLSRLKNLLPKRGAKKDEAPAQQLPPEAPTQAAPQPPAESPPEQPQESPDQIQQEAPQEQQQETQRPQKSPGIGAKEIAKINEDIIRMNTEIEKLRAFLEAIREMRTNTDERTQKVSETVGEIRSTLYQTEASLKEMENKIDQHEDALASVKPKRFMEEIQERDRRLGALEARFERTESVAAASQGDIKKVQDMLRDIGSLENIVEVSRNIAKKILEIDAKEKSINKISDKIEKLLVDMSEKLNEFETYKANQDRVSDVTQDLAKTVDEINITIGAKLVSKDDIALIKDEIMKSIEDVKAAALATGEESPEVKALKEEKEGVKVLLESLDSEYKEGTLSEDDYTKSRDANLKRLRDIDSRVGKVTGKVAVTAEPEPIVTDAEEKKARQEKPAQKKQDRLLMELQEMFDKGLISKEAYERSKKAFGSRG